MWCRPNPAWIDNPSIGYMPVNPDGSMSYDAWCEVYGKYRWYHEDGTTRTIYPLEYQWKNLYDIVTKQCDLRLQFEPIYDVETFTSEFLALVNDAWLKYKTELEMFSGTLDGTNIDPLMFEAGFTRTIEGSQKGSGDSSTTSQNTNSSTQSMGERTDTAENKARGINYVQGVQGLSPETTPIGQMGTGHASTMQDNISEQTATVGNQNNTSSSSGSASGNDNYNNNVTYNEKVHETRINYYDNLAFLREREDRLKYYKPFYSYFLPLFKEIRSMNGWW